MKQSRRATDTFESQLQQKLNTLTQTKSHKKIKIKPPIQNLRIYKYELDEYSNIKQNAETYEMRHSQASDQSKSKTNSAHKERISSYVEESRRKDDPKQIIINQGEIKRESKGGVLDLIQNRELCAFLEKNFGTKCESLDLSYFLAKCLAQFSHDSSIPDQQIKLIFLEMQQEITTTDPNSISLNALQLAIKKFYGSFPLYIGTKIVKSEQELISRKLKQKQKQLEKMGNQTQKQKQSKQRQLSQNDKLLAQREKQVSKKQKLLQNKQKQFMDRVKNHKKMLEQRAQKLTEEHIAKLESVCEKIEKKINTYERTMKYRVESMNHKINEIHHFRQFKQAEIKNKIIKEMDEKYEKAYANKMKKYETECKQLADKCEILRKQSKELEEENNKLASIMVKLENKVVKQDAKIKQLADDLRVKKDEIKQLKFLCTEKQVQNQKLIKKLVIAKQEQQIASTDKSYRQAQSRDKGIKMKNSQSKKSLSGVKKTNRGETLELQAQHIQLKDAVEVYELVLQTINSNGNNRLNQQILGRSLWLLVKVIPNQSLSCQFLLDLTFETIMKKYCQKFTKGFAKPKKQQKGKKQFLSQTEAIISQQYQHYLKSQSKKPKKQPKNTFSIWKLSSILCLISSTIPNTIFYLHHLYTLSQDPSTYNKMYENITNSDQNFIYAIIAKCVSEARDQEKESQLNMLALLTDFVLDFKVVGDGRFDGFWKYVGKDVINCFFGLVQCTIKDSQYFHEFYDRIQKISIMVQRAIVAHQLPVDRQCETAFQALTKKCRGSLLQRNLNSILESVASRDPNRKLLADIDDGE